MISKPGRSECSSSRSQHEQVFTREWLDLAVKSAGLGAWSSGIESNFQEIFYTEKYRELWKLNPGDRWTREMWLGRIYSPDRESARRTMDAAIAGEAEDFGAEYRCFAENGYIHWHKSWGKVIRDADSRVIRITGVLSDITDRKKIEDERNQLIATLTHDIRNPLAAARANVELVERFPDRISDRNLILDRVVMSIARVDRIVQDLLDSSRIRAGGAIPILMSQGNLKALIEDTLKDFSVQYGDRFNLETSGDFQGQWFCAGIRRAVENLVMNAVKYGDPKKPICIVLKKEAGHVLMSVKNEGAPIPPEMQQHLFESFKRAKGTEESGVVGWGLGLTVVKAVAQALNGHVTVMSGDEIGTTFTIEFPT